MDFKNTLMWKEIHETEGLMQNIMSENASVMDKITAAVKNTDANNIVCAARGTSDHALTYFKYVCEQLTPYVVSLAAPSVVTQYNGKLSYKRSIIIGCSQSGKAADVLEIIKKANADGAVTISMTNDRESPLAKAAKFHLFCAAGPELSVAATKTFSAQLFLCLWLAARLADDNELENKLGSLYKTIADVMPVIEKESESFADELKNMKSGFVLSRGTTYPIALESALKLQETCYIQMKGYAGSDFYHGPMAMVNKQTPVLVYCADNGNAAVEEIVRPDQQKCLDQMLTIGAPLYLVTTDKILADKYSDKARVALIPMSGDDRLAMFGFALFAQLLACRISCAIGNNPDSPRVLHKVTVTK